MWICFVVVVAHYYYQLNTDNFPFCWLRRCLLSFFFSFVVFLVVQFNFSNTNIDVEHASSIGFCCYPIVILTFNEFIFVFFFSFLLHQIKIDECNQFTAEHKNRNCNLFCFLFLIKFKKATIENSIKTHNVMRILF